MADILLNIKDNQELQKYTHPGHSFRCADCRIIRDALGHLAGLLEQLIYCPVCKKLPKSYIKLPCDHLLCQSCLIQFKQAVKEGKLEVLTCRSSKIKTDAKFLLSKTDADLVELKIKVSADVTGPSGSSDMSFSKAACPKCRMSIILGTQRDPVLAHCGGCNYFFCSKCHKDFHGTSLCPELDAVGTKTTTVNTPVPNQYGASAPSPVDLDLCIICLENRKEFILFPCAHYSYCATCVESLTICAICRSQIISKSKVYE